MTKHSAYADLTLLALLKNHDEEAYAEIYHRYSRELFAYAITLVKLQDLAEDIVHDVFLKLWDNRFKINIEKSFRSYLYRICHNQAYDVNRMIAKNQLLLEELVQYFQPTGNHELSLSKDARDYIQLLKDALNALSPQRRRIYQMCKFEKKSYVTVARELQISPNTVKNHMVQTTAILRAYFKQHSDVSLLLFVVLEMFF